MGKTKKLINNKKKKIAIQKKTFKCKTSDIQVLRKSRGLNIPKIKCGISKKLYVSVHFDMCYIIHYC